MKSLFFIKAIILVCAITVSHARGTSVMGGAETAAGLTPKMINIILNEVDLSHSKINGIYVLGQEKEGLLVAIELNSLEGNRGVCEMQRFYLKLDISNFPANIDYQVTLLDLNNECRD